MDSDDDMELDEVAEMVGFEMSALEALRAGDPGVWNADRTLRCPYCSPAKKKQSYAYRDLLQHATAVAVGIRGPEAAGKHSALKLYLESDLASLAPPPLERPPQAQCPEVLPRTRDAESKLVCPWSVVIFKSASIGQPRGEGDGQTYHLGKAEIKTHFGEFKPDKVHVVWGPSGHMGFSILEFGRGFNGLNDALALEKHFLDAGHGRKDFERNWLSGNLGQGFYGWLARNEDVEGPPRWQDEAVVKHLTASSDLKDIGMVGDEMKKIHGLQVQNLLESLAEKERESMTLKTELELMQKRAEADRRVQLQRWTVKLGAWTGCQIL